VRVWSLIATIVLGSLTGSVWAQEGQQAASGQAAARPPVAVIDVGFLLKNHPTMKAEIEAIETRMAAADKSMSDKRDAILKQMEQLREKYTEGTPDYEREEKAIAAKDTEFRLELVKMRKEFDSSRANVLVKVYSEITHWVKYLSDNMGVQLVMRITREQMDPSKPETVQMVMSQDVLYYNATIDYTDWILKALQSEAAKTANARPAAGAPVQR
jgi:Skp family chaperone for outer membrane proteins